jgi:hypothetical protein
MRHAVVKIARKIGAAQQSVCGPDNEEIWIAEPQCGSCPVVTLHTHPKQLQY